MTSKYSRQNKYQQKKVEPTKHIKTGFSALQKTIALIGSILSIIVASLTINNALNKQNKTEASETKTTTVIREIEKTTPVETSTAVVTETPISSVEPVVETSSSTSELESSSIETNSSIPESTSTELDSNQTMP